MAELAAANRVWMIRWPEEKRERDALRTLGLPRILLIAEDAAPPEYVDPLEDWVRRSATEDELRACVLNLDARAGAGRGQSLFVENGRVHHRGEWVALSPLEELLLGALASEFGQVVALHGAVGREGPALSANAVRVHVARLRKRIAAIGLVVRTVHNRGYVLEADT